MSVQVQPGSGQLTRVISGDVNRGRISGDGSTIVWQALEADQLKVFRQKNGGATECLSQTSQSDMWPEVSHDGDTVVFCRQYVDPGEDWDVMVWHQGQVQKVSGDPGRSELDPVVSRDGRTIAWTSTDLATGESRVEVSRNGVVTTLTEGSTGNPGAVRMSRDGAVFFWRERVDDETTHHYRLQDGQTARLFQDGPSPGGSLAVGAAGGVGAWTGRGPSSSDVFTADLTGPGKGSLLRDTPLHRESWATLSGDGQTLAWTRIEPDTLKSEVCLYGPSRQEVTIAATDQGTLKASLSEDGRRGVLSLIPHDPSEPLSILRWDDGAELSPAAGPGLPIACPPGPVRP